MDNLNLLYLTGMPQEIEKHGLCKTLLVRREMIHIKHILTEIFVRKTIDIEKYLEIIDMSLFRYMEIMTNRIRKLYKFPRSFRHDVNNIVKHEYENSFFRNVEFCEGLNSSIVLDFDGVITSKKFRDLYLLCDKRGKKVEVCSANPTIENEWFTKKDLPLPVSIHSMKGKKQKLKRLIELSNKLEVMFFIDNEPEYLEFAWLFGIKTYHFTNGKIKYFTLNSK